MLGWGNPLPMQLGGHPTMTETVYRQMRLALGKSYGIENDLAIGPEGGLRDLWTRCEAREVAAELSVWEHAIWQAWPHTATSFLRVWENMLLIAPTGSEAERQERAAEKYTRTIDATVPGLRRQLKEIAEDFDVEAVPYDLSTTTVLGKAFGPLPGALGAAYGTGAWASRESTEWPNFSDIYIVRVLHAGTTTNEILARAADLLDDVLPSWIDFEFYAVADGPEGEGFYADGGPDSDSFTDWTLITP
jgi:hypothetical protein